MRRSMVDPLTTAAISWSFSAAGWLISPILTRFLNQCFDALEINLPKKFQSQKKTLIEKIEKLQTIILPQLLILTDAAHQSPHRHLLNNWLQKLKSAFYEAEHVLGLVEYERLEEKVNSLFPPSSSSKLTWKNLKGKLLQISSEKKNLIKSLENLEKIVNEAMEFVPLLDLPSSSANNSNMGPIEQHRETISTPGSTVIGRDKDRDHIVKLLRGNKHCYNTPFSIASLWKQFRNILSLMIYKVLQLIFGKLVFTFLVERIFHFLSFVIRFKIFQYFFPNQRWFTGAELQEIPSELTSKCYSVIGIWGMGGSGKTTLAQYVCDYEKKAKYFDHIIWVHVSQNFNVRAIMRSIWESVSESNCPMFESLDELSSQLAEKLREKKFLLVLDDVWCNKGVREQEAVNQLFASLRDGKQGSKILVTTRDEEAVRTLGSLDLKRLPELADDDFLSLFLTHALRDVRDNGDLEELRTIGKQIVGKLCRLPLAAITVAGQLRTRPNLDFWLSMLDKSFLNDVMGVLYLSYQHLSPPLQRCFAFCALFPRGYLFEQDRLVKLWIAEGFIEPEGSEHIVDIANRYFLELNSCSLFQAGRMCHDLLYSMHDLIHDLAQHVSRGECFEIRSGEKMEIPIQTRHLHVADDTLEEYLEKICKLKDLRTIIVVSKKVTCDPLKKKHLDALFTKLRKLYIADLLHIENLPESVIHLKNLRYLTFQIAQTDTIPNVLNTLYQLRTLCIWKAYELGKNHVAIPNAGRLILLQDLGEFHVRNKGFELMQLKHLNHLFGTLIIKNLNSVEGEEEANQADLSKKQGIRNLHYYWDYENGDVMRDIDVQILDCLCPPLRTKQLFFNGYSGKRFPSWILQQRDKIPYLKHLELSNCRGLESLQRINELSNLLSLTISSLPRLKRWEHLPPKLTELKLTDCLSLAFGLQKDLHEIMSVNRTQISQIVTFLGSFTQKKAIEYTNVQFNYVKKMMKLADHTDTTISGDLRKCLEKRLELICQLNVNGELYLPRLLKKLSIRSCFMTDSVLAVSLNGLNSLTDLELVDIITITCIPEEVLVTLTSLMVLRITGCLLLTSIGGWDTHGTLEQLWIYNCPNLTLEASIVPNSCNAAEVPSSSRNSNTSYSILNYVFLQCCIALDDTFKNLVSLETLQVWDCPTLENPDIGFLKSLIILDLLDCPNLISLRGLSELEDLRKLDTRRCQKFECHSDSGKLPKLKELKICRFSQLEQLVSRDGLSSLVALELWQSQEESFSPEECEVFGCLSSLQQISFYHCTMFSLPDLQCIHSLRDLNINYCANLTTLSDLPQSVNNLLICGCNEAFTKSCQDANGTNGHKISSIPNKRINL